MGYLTFPHLVDYDVVHKNYGRDSRPRWWEIDHPSMEDPMRWVGWLSGGGGGGRGLMYLLRCRLVIRILFLSTSYDSYHHHHQGTALITITI